jgi:hypothetical protein
VTRGLPEFTDDRAVDDRQVQKRMTLRRFNDDHEWDPYHDEGFVRVEMVSGTVPEYMPPRPSDPPGTTRRRVHEESIGKRTYWVRETGSEQSPASGRFATWRQTHSIEGDPQRGQAVFDRELAVAKFNSVIEDYLAKGWVRKPLKPRERPPEQPWWREMLE